MDRLDRRSGALGELIPVLKFELKTRLHRGCGCTAKWPKIDFSLFGSYWASRPTGPSEPQNGFLGPMPPLKQVFRASHTLEQPSFAKLEKSFFDPFFVY